MSRAVMPSVTLAAVPSFTALVSRQPHVATLLGFVLGMADYFLLRGLGVTMQLGSHDATLSCACIGTAYSRSQTPRRHRSTICRTWLRRPGLSMRWSAMR